MTINKTRGLLYRLAKILGDWKVLSSGRVTKRVSRRAAGKVTRRGLGKLFK